MNLLTGSVKKLYFKYLSAAFGSALIAAVYSIVDCAVVGQYEGPRGVAALATVALSGISYTVWGCSLASAALCS